jgi:hypothetical protein
MKTDVVFHLVAVEPGEDERGVMNEEVAYSVA